MIGSAADVFISYKAEDRARLAPLVHALEAEGFTVWWDAHIGGGTNWRQDIEEHLDAAKCVIVAWSKRSVGPEGEFVRDEAMRAKRHHTYLPIRIDDVSPPLGFGEVQALSLKNWKGDRPDPRLAALVDAVRQRITGEHIDHHSGRHEQPRISRRAAVAGGIGIGTVAIASTGGWLLLKPDVADARRIAVLPFANLSGDEEQNYFSDGIAEELRAALSRVGMEVIGRASSVAVKDLDSQSAARKLGVANILTGSVRRSPDVIRINAQLVSGKDGVVRWAQSYDRVPGDAIKIQSDIAGSVANALSVALGNAARAALALGGTADSVAQDLLLRSLNVRRTATSIEELRQAVQLADAAIARDPRYAQAYAGRADVLAGIAVEYAKGPAQVSETLKLAEESAAKALRIAPKLGSARAVLAFIDSSRLRFPEALEQLRAAVAQAPDDPNVLNVAANSLPYLGEAGEALRLANRLTRLDPLDPLAFKRKSEVEYCLRQYAECVVTSRKTQSLDPKTTRLWSGCSFILMGKIPEATAEFAAMRPSPFRVLGQGLIAARTNDRTTAERAINKLYAHWGNTASYQAGQIWVALGEPDKAFAEFDGAIAALDPGMIYLKIDPFMDPVRKDPRFAALITKLRFP